MKKTLMHAQPGPVTFELDMAAGVVEVSTEDHRDYAEVVLEPMHPGDEVAEDLINRAQDTSRGATHGVRIPHPEPTTFGGGCFQVTSGRAVTVVSGSNITMVNGRVVGGTGVVQQVTTGGAVRVTVCVPQGSSVQVTTASADVTTRNALEDVRFRSTSGDLAVDEARQVRAGTVSGDVFVGTAHEVRANTTSGDLDARTVAVLDVRTVSGDVDVHRLMGPEAEIESVSGDIDVHAAVSSRLAARTVSGDIRITAAEGAQVHTDTHTVFGRVRTPRQ